MTGLKCWAPKISWLWICGLVIFLRTQPCILVSNLTPWTFTSFNVSGAASTRTIQWRRGLYGAQYPYTVCTKENRWFCRGYQVMITLLRLILSTTGKGNCDWWGKLQGGISLPTSKTSSGSYFRVCQPRDPHVFHHYCGMRTCTFDAKEKKSNSD